MDGVGELAELLRGWRERLTPADAGLPAGAARRTPGLRREELAVLAGMSIDYIVRLEQGRASAPSAQVCVALARALRLSDVEQAHLFQLAGHAVGHGRISRLIPASVRRLVDRLGDNPIAVCDAMWTLITGNTMWATLMGDLSGQDEHDRNVVWRHFTHAPNRVVFTPTERDDFEISMVADLRLAVGRYPDDPRPHRLIEQLCRVSDSFRTRWATLQVGDHAHANKAIDHPEVGRLELDCDVLTTQRGDLRIVVYTAAPGSEAESKLALLATIGTQAMAPAD
ncbi:MAG TPA: helix-turn-helix transcriptional regulator [Pseudonocardiaceae bacterium]